MVKKSSPKPPRAKRESDEVYNVRRRLKRRAASLRKQGRTFEAQHLEAQAAQTYAHKSKSEGSARARLEYARDKIAQARSTLYAFLRREEKRQFERSNGSRQPREPEKEKSTHLPKRGKTLSQQMREIDELLSEQERGDVSALDLQETKFERRGALTTEERAVLYGALRDEWLGVPREYRQDLILKKYGAESEEELFSMLEERLAQYEEEREVWMIPLEEKYKLFAGI